MRLLNFADMFKGMLAEQFVGQELLSALDNDLFYWAREAKSSTAEVDFLVEQGGQVYPIEVKSGPKGRLKSLHLLLDSYPQIKKAFIVSNRDFGEIPEQKLAFAPLYYVYGLFQNNLSQRVKNG
jgi:predicted AAA+ superfamily ATPase